jgi:hypothetical protein
MVTLLRKQRPTVLVRSTAGRAEYRYQGLACITARGAVALHSVNIDARILTCHPYRRAFPADPEVVARRPGQRRRHERLLASGPAPLDPPTFHQALLCF